MNPERGRHLAEELVRHLDQHAGPVSCIGFAPAGASMEQVDHYLERLTHERVRALTLDVDHEADAAGVVLESGVVETLRAWGERWVGGLSTHTVRLLWRRRGSSRFAAIARPTAVWSCADVGVAPGFPPRRSRLFLTWPPSWPRLCHYRDTADSRIPSLPDSADASAGE